MGRRLKFFRPLFADQADRGIRLYFDVLQWSAVTGALLCAAKEAKSFPLTAVAYVSLGMVCAYVMLLNLNSVASVQGTTRRWILPLVRVVFEALVNRG
jgi:hypothetical protein